MGTRGRKPKPTALKVVTGNPGHRPLNKNEPTPEPGTPIRPKWLKGEAKREWERVTGELARIGVVTPIDASMLATYCQLFGEFVTAKRKGLPFSAAEIAQMRALASSFGLEPSSRGRLAGKSGNPKSKWSSPHG